MKQCSICGNDYDKLMEISLNGRTGYYDCFECAIHDLAPKCEACGLSIIGHGVEVEEAIFCSAHCARKHGKVGISDRVPSKMFLAGSSL